MIPLIVFALPVIAEICDDPRLAGRAIASPTSDNDPRCGIKNPVEIGAINGVTFPSHPQMDCRLATRLADWVDYAQAQAPSPITAITSGSTFECRKRRGDGSGKLSEHGKGSAIDITAITLANGKRISVLDDWEQSAFLHAIYEPACGIFNTRLGPTTNAAHRDHFHFDMKERRTPWCE